MDKVIGSLLIKSVFSIFSQYAFERRLNSSTYGTTITDKFMQGITSNSALLDTCMIHFYRIFTVSEIIYEINSVGWRYHRYFRKFIHQK